MFEIGDLLNDLPGYQLLFLKNIHLYLQMMICADIFIGTICDPSKREKLVFKIDCLPQVMAYFYVYAREPRY